MKKILLGIFKHISSRRRFHFLLLLLLTLVGALAEIVSLGSVVPFLGILTQPDVLFNSDRMQWFVNLIELKQPSDLVLPLTLIFIISAIISGFLRTLLLYFSIKISNATGSDLSQDVYKKTLFQPYSVHIARNSSEIISGITQKVTAVTSVLTSLITVFTSFFLLLSILGTLVYIDPIIAITSLSTFGIIYALIAIFTKRKLASNSRDVAFEQTQVVQVLQEGLGAIRDVLIDGTQKIYANNYGLSVRKLLKATGDNQFITISPRYAMETIGILLIAGFAYYAFIYEAENGGINAMFPVLGALALAAQRLLPLLQQIYGNWSGLYGNEKALEEVLHLLNQPMPAYLNLEKTEPLVLKKTIALKNLSFKYADNSPLILDDVNFSFEKGSKIGVVGNTGSGKSTLLDLLMYLLKPTNGQILVDDIPLSDFNLRNWQRSIAHVPQNIFLTDGTIAENIAFSVAEEKINHNFVIDAAKQAKLLDFIETLDDKFETKVGERGVKLSGGQKQRIGIARALYKQSSILILDEATSALDSETEKEIIQVLDNLSENLTTIMIAHRITTLHSCNKILEVRNGKILDLGDYANFTNSKT